MYAAEGAHSAAKLRKVADMTSVHATHRILIATEINSRRIRNPHSAQTVGVAKSEASPARDSRKSKTKIPVSKLPSLDL